MEIDDDVEQLVRTGLGACIDQDFSRLKAALERFPDNETALKAVELCVSLIVSVLRNTGTSARNVAEAVATEEGWAAPTVAEVEDFLGALERGGSLVAAVPTENIYVLSFVIAAYLISAGRRDDEEWWNHLDRLEAALEAQPS